MTAQTRKVSRKYGRVPVTSVELTLPFLEQRQYLHGTTLFEALRKHVPSEAALTFKVSQIIKSNCIRIEAADDANERNSHSAASLAWKNGEGRGSLAVVPLDPTHPIERHSYDESLVTQKCSLSGQSVELDVAPPFTFVATLIPMFKTLLKSAHPMEQPGQWMFTRLELDRHPDTIIALGLSLDGVVGGSLARSRIMLGGKSIGALYYSWVN